MRYVQRHLSWLGAHPVGAEQIDALAAAEGMDSATAVTRLLGRKAAVDGVCDPRADRRNGSFPVLGSSAAEIRGAAIPIDGGWTAQEVILRMRTIALEDAVAMISPGASLMIGGFMGVGTPEPIIDELVRQKKRDLIVIQTTRPSPALASLSPLG